MREWFPLPPRFEVLKALLLGTAAIWLSLTSSVGVWFLPQGATRVVAVVYCISLAAVLINHRSENAHRVAMMIGTLFWLARGLGFVELLLGGATDLGGPVVERLVITVLVIGWHIDRLKLNAVDRHLPVQVDG